MLKGIIDPAECACCRLCCNFHQNSVWESPFIPQVQALRLESEGVPVEMRQRGGWSFAFHFEGGEAVNCPKLDVQTGCTMPPEEKPFECSVWPLRMMERNGKLVIGRYRDCPALTGDRLKQLDRFAVGELRETLLSFVSRYPESIRPFSPEYEVIWEGSLPESD